MPCLFRETIPVPRGSGAGIGTASSTDNAVIRRDFLMVCTFHATENRIAIRFLRQDLYHLGMQMNIHLIFAKFSLEGGDHVRRMIGYRKYPVSPLRFQRAARLLQQITYPCIVKAVKSTVQKLFIGTNILK